MNHFIRILKKTRKILILSLAEVTHQLPDPPVLAVPTGVTTCSRFFNSTLSFALALEFASVPRIQSSLLLIFLLKDPMLHLTALGWSELSELGEWLEFKTVPNFYYSKRIDH